ncbi:MAG: aminotransferase class III-fold pyridoxal phosphate-dependent enzyme [Gemmataceae bacterium]
MTTPAILKFSDVGKFHVGEEDHALFERLLGDFVPPGAFDAHAHLYDLRHLAPTALPTDLAGPAQVNHEVLVSTMQRWMGQRVVTEGLYFPFPVRHLDCAAANRFLAESLRGRPGCRGLMMIRPDDDPARVEAVLLAERFAGFKVYHVFAARSDTFHAGQEEFLPEWAWELAQRHGLAIMMHMVLPRALSEPRNQLYIREHCLRYPEAKLILAHAGRGFNARHTIDGIHAVRGLTNVFFDTSAICEAGAFEAILRACGPGRLLYGSDFPVSELRGRCVSVGDGFFWLYDHNAEWKSWLHASPQLVGLESLIALRQACHTLGLIDRDIESIFGNNARQLLGLRQPDGARVQQLYREARTRIPGGTHLLSKRPEMFAPDVWPAYYESAIGCEMVDPAGRRFLDMSHCGILSCILGFADPDVNAAVLRRVHLGAMATQQTTDEVELAHLLCEIHPWADQARFTRAGGEAMAVAVRLARAFTGRDRIAVCGYHGWHDWYLAANLTGASQLEGHLLPGLEPSGVPRGLTGSVTTFRYNRLDDLEQALARCEDGLAAIVMEPTRGVDPEPGFLEAVREQACRRGAVLIFDEISSAWRLCLGGAHQLYSVTPDLAVFAKAMSNGFAMGAVIGRAEVMQAAQGSFISSTYWTEGIGPAAALACIRKMQRIDVPTHLTRLGNRVMAGWKELAAHHRLPLVVTGRPVSCSLGFTHPQATALITLLTKRMLERGILAGATCSLTLAHEMHHVERYLTALDGAFAELAQAISEDAILERLNGPVKHTTFSRLVD